MKERIRRWRRVCLAGVILVVATWIVVAPRYAEYLNKGRCCVSLVVRAPEILSEQSQLRASLFDSVQPGQLVMWPPRHELAANCGTSAPTESLEAEEWVRHLAELSSLVPPERVCCVQALLVRSVESETGERELELRAPFHEALCRSVLSTDVVRVDRAGGVVFRGYVNDQSGWWTGAEAPELPSVSNVVTPTRQSGGGG